MFLFACPGDVIFLSRQIRTARDPRKGCDSLGTRCFHVVPFGFPFSAHLTRHEASKPRSLEDSRLLVADAAKLKSGEFYLDREPQVKHMGGDWSWELNWLDIWDQGSTF